MAVPNEVLKALDEMMALYYQRSKHDPDYDRDIYDIVLEWQSSLPQAPQPDWDDAPAEANWWIVHSDGLEEWWCIKNDGYPYADGSSWEVSGARWDDGTWKPCGSGRKHNIDIGIDWRELRQRRPEAQ